MNAKSRPVRKKDAGVTHVTERPFSCGEYTPGRVDGSNGRPLGPAQPIGVTDAASLSVRGDPAATPEPG